MLQDSQVNVFSFLWCGFQLHVRGRVSFLPTQPWLLNAIILNTTASNCIYYTQTCNMYKYTEKRSQAHSSFCKDLKGQKSSASLCTESTEDWNVSSLQKETWGSRIHNFSPAFFPWDSLTWSNKNRKRRVSLFLLVFWLLCQLWEKNSPISLIWQIDGIFLWFLLMRFRLFGNRSQIPMESKWSTGAG